jgi:probable phosphoglycerate mutase
MGSKPKKIVLIRHGETAWTKTGQHTGIRTDLPLTDRGKEEAKLVGAKLAQFQFTKVWMSPLRRVTETAQIIGHTEQAQVTEDLLEWDYGDYEGLTTIDIRKQQPGWVLWRDGCPNGEMPADVGRRADNLIATVEQVDGDVALYGSGHLLRVLGARWVSFTPAAGQHLMLDTATISVLGFEHEWKVIQAWNQRPNG